MGVPFIARLPQYLYSVADDGLYVNLFASSRITWSHAGQQVTLIAESEFPYDGNVTPYADDGRARENEPTRAHSRLGKRPRWRSKVNGSRSSRARRAATPPWTARGRTRTA
jgi:DUF1680 family protein